MGEELSSGNNSSLFSNRGACRNKSAPSNGAPDPASWASQYLATVLRNSLLIRHQSGGGLLRASYTVRVNKLSDRVSVYQSDNLKSIPRSEMWNLVVSNPPHFIDQYAGDIRAHDPDWRIK